MTFSTTPVPSTSSCCNLVAAITKLDGDVELFHNLAKLFIDTLPDQLCELTVAMTEGCPRKISDAAHSIKGSVRYFLADVAYDAAQHLELISVSGQRSDIDSACESLLREVEKLRCELLAVTR